MKRLLGILYPRSCPICGKLLEDQKRNICPECQRKVKLIKAPICLKCGKPIRQTEKEYCSDCERHVHYYEEGRAAFVYRGLIQKSILNMKLHNRRTYADFFAEARAVKLYECQKRWQIDLICPVPLHWQKRYFRGFNQAELLAKPIGKLLGIPVYPRLLRKIKETSEQKELDRKKRQKNLKNAFQIDSYDVKLKRILIVDDVYTTGSTIDAAAAVLLKAGAAAVYFLTACIGTERDEEELE